MARPNDFHERLEKHGQRLANTSHTKGKDYANNTL